MNIFRQTLWGITALSALTATGSMMAQYTFGMNPCVLCILQRVAVLAVGLVALATAFSKQHTHCRRTASALVVSIPALYGAGVAVYQMWIQSLPSGSAPDCGAPWTFHLRDWPLFDWYEPIIRGFGNCAVPDYVLGIPLPVWSVLYFSAVLLAVWWAWQRTRRI